MSNATDEKERARIEMQINRPPPTVRRTRQSAGTRRLDRAAVARLMDELAAEDKALTR